MCLSGCWECTRTPLELIGLFLCLDPKAKNPLFAWGKIRKARGHDEGFPSSHYFLMLRPHGRIFIAGALFRCDSFLQGDIATSTKPDLAPMW